MAGVKRIAVLDDHQDVARSTADWSPLEGRATVETFRRHIDDEDELVALLSAFEIVVAMRERTPFPRSVLERLPRLELLVTTGPFNAAIDIDAAEERGVTVCGTRGRLPPTAELTWALVLACVKQLPACQEAMRGGDWQTVLGGDLAGRRLGIVGLGRYGTLVADVGRAFGMDVVAWSPNLTAARCEEVGVGLATKEELFATSDVVSVHLVLSERTRGVVGARELRAMKPSAFLVNTSRGPLVDERALVRALEEGRIAGAGLDVFDVEPLPVDHPLRRLENVVLTPHMGYVTRATYEVFYGDAVEDIVAYLDGRVVRPVQRAPQQ